MIIRKNFISLITIVRKEVYRILRIWMQTLVPPVITMTLYFVIFGRVIGSQIRDIKGFSYIEFIVPGIIMMSVISNSYSNVVSSFFSSKFQRSIEEILISPTPASIIVIGYVFGGMTRGLLVGMLVTISSLFFVQLIIYNVGIVFIFVLLTSIVFSLAAIINALFAKKFDDISIVPTFVLTPLTYLSGVFYSISLLPEIWQGISKINPILYMVNGFRYGFLGVSDINIFYGLSIIIIFIVILFFVNVYLIRKGVGLRT